MNSPPQTPLAVLWYTLARIALLAVVAGMLYLAGARGALLLLLALIISGLLSYIVLGRLRDMISVGISNRVERKAEERRQRQSVEDEDLL